MKKLILALFAATALAGCDTYMLQGDYECDNSVVTGQVVNTINQNLKKINQEKKAFYLERSPGQVVYIETEDSELTELNDSYYFTTVKVCEAIGDCAPNQNLDACVFIESELQGYTPRFWTDYDDGVVSAMRQFMTKDIRYLVPKHNY